jgi:hypothetical protein
MEPMPSYKAFGSPLASPHQPIETASTRFRAGSQTSDEILAAAAFLGRDKSPAALVDMLFGGTQSMGSINLSNLLHALGAESDSLFSILGPASSNASPDPLIQALESSLGIAGANGATSSSSTANSIASSNSSLQAQELDSLFGSPQMVEPFLNTLG